MDFTQSWGGSHFCWKWLGPSHKSKGLDVSQGTALQASLSEESNLTPAVRAAFFCIGIQVI